VPGFWAAEFLNALGNAVRHGRMSAEALLASVDGFSRSLAELRQRIDRGDADGLNEFFTIAKQFRDGIV